MTSGKNGQMARGPRRRTLIKLAVASAVAGGSVLATKESFGRDGVASEEILDIVVVGAGLSGLTTARDLLHAGCESFLVLEARDRVGGRTLNCDVGNGQVSDVGGQWIGPGQTAVADLARELGVATFPSYYEGDTIILGGDGRLAIDFKGTFGTDHVIAEKLSKMSRDVPSGAPWTSPRAAELDQLSVGDWLATQDIKPEDRSGWDASMTLTGGVTPAKMGLLHFLSMINSANCEYFKLDSIKDSAQGTRFEGGAQRLSAVIAEELGDRLRLSCPVRSISNWDSPVVTLHTDQGVVRARQVVMALHPALCHQLEFSPRLPPGRATLQQSWPAHSPARKTAMVYPRPFWREQGLNGHVIEVNGPVIWAYDNSPRHGEVGVINAFVRNSYLPAEPHDAQQMLVDIYTRALGEEARSPIGYHDQDWGRVDPWTLTCVSAIPPGFWSTHGESLKPACGGLIWSGTETADIWAGYMDGAVRAGHQSAFKALNALRAG